MRPQIPQRVTEEIAMDVDTQQWRAVQSHTRHTKREKKSWLYIDVNGNHQVTTYLAQRFYDLQCFIIVMTSVIHGGWWW